VIQLFSPLELVLILCFRPKYRFAAPQIPGTDFCDCDFDVGYEKVGDHLGITLNLLAKLQAMI